MRTTMDGITEGTSVAELYRQFAEREALPDAPLYSELARGVSDDPAVVGLLERLPKQKQQPNLLLGAFRYLFGTPTGYQQMRDRLISDWTRVEAVVLARRTQTNEPARCAALLPLLARLDGPLSLIEIGASAGLCLYPDLYRYDYDGHLVGPQDSPVLIRCTVSGDPPLPTAVPSIAWRGGVDLNPLDLTAPDDLRWLECLVWPGQDTRVRRLRAAGGVARHEPPVILAGDAFDRLGDVVAMVPRDTTPVIFHTAVAAYLTERDRRRLERLVRDLPGHWITQEGPDILPTTARRLTRGPGDRPTFVLALDSEPVAFTAPHGGWLDWL